MANTPDNDNGGSFVDEVYSRMQGFLDAFDKKSQTPTRPAKDGKAEKEAGLFAVKSKEELLELVQRQHKVLQGLFSHPMNLANVLAVYAPADGKKSRVDLTHQGRVINVDLPEGLELSVGQPVRINHQTLQIVEAGPVVSAGPVAKVRSVLNKETSEVELNGASRVVLNGLADTDKLREGDKVVLDASNSVIMLWLGAGETKFKLGKRPEVTWDDIGGLEQTKRELKEALIWPITKAAFFAHYKKKPIRGALLFGPPGCGKTMLFEASAYEICEQLGEEALETGYLLIRGPDILSEYVSIAERRLITAFEAGRQHFKKTGRRAILAIDECEALFKKRGTGISTDVTDSIVQTFLGQTNGLQDGNPFVILATNMPHVLDEAVVRPGRIDRRIKVGRPDRTAAVQIIGKLLKEIPIADGNAESLTQFTVDEFFSDKRALCELELEDGTKTKFGLAQLVSGAMLVNVVDQATSKAMYEDIETDKLTALTKQDVLDAVDKVFTESKDLDHGAAAKEFAQTLKSAVKDIKPLRQIVKP